MKNLNWISDPLGSPIYGIPDIGAIEYVPPNIMGSDSIKIGSEVYLYEDGRFRYTEKVTEDSEEVDLAIIVNKDWIPTSPVDHVNTIKITSYNRYGDKVLEWTENDKTAGKRTQYRICGLLQEERYTIMENGTPRVAALSDETGNLEFELTKESAIVNISITREDRPIIVQDLTLDVIGTGEMLKFDITASDMDGIDGVQIIYNHDSPSFNGQLSLRRDEGTSNYGRWAGYVSVPVDIVGTLTYKAIASDIGGLKTYSKNHTIRIIDVIVPSVMEDLSSYSTGSRDQIDLRFRLHDNIELDRTTVEIMEGTELYQADLIMTGDIYGYDHRLYDTDIESISYRLNLTDTSGNMNITLFKNIEILDNDPPTLLSDDSDQTAYTGEVFVFNIKLYDLRGISSSRVDYTINGITNSISGEGDIIQGSIIVPIDTVGYLEYGIFAQDLSGNKMSLSGISVPVIDIIPPWIVSDRSDEYGTTGDPFNIAVSASDNVDLKSVVFQFWSDETPSTNLTLRHGEGFYRGKIMIPSDMTAHLVYRVWVQDSSGNVHKQKDKTITIIDNDPPEIKRSSANRVAGDFGYNFEVEVVDNVGLKDVYLFIEIHGELIEIDMIGDSGVYKKFLNIVNGPFTFWFRAVDMEGNSVESLQTLEPEVLKDEVDNIIENIIEKDENEIGDNIDIVPETVIRNIADSKVLVVITMVFCIVTIIMILFSFIMGRRSTNNSENPDNDTEIASIDESGPDGSAYERDPDEMGDPSSDNEDPIDDVEDINIDDIMKEIDDMMIPLQEISIIEDMVDDLI